MVIYLDSGDPAQMHAFGDKVAGFTTNPTLLKNSPANWKQTALDMVMGKPISFEVFGDDVESMHNQARLIASWGENCYVKIPVTDTKGNSYTNGVDKYAIQYDTVNQGQANEWNEVVILKF